MAKKIHLGTGKAVLTSVVALGFDKEASLVECLLVQSANEPTKGPDGDLFTECHLIRSAK